MEDDIDDRAILAETYNHTARALFDKAEAIKEGIHASDMFSSAALVMSSERDACTMAVTRTQQHVELLCEP